MQQQGSSRPAAGDTLATECWPGANLHPLPGTPGGIPPETDCNLRRFVWEAGKKLMPRRGSFKTLFDSMQLEACGIEGPAELVFAGDVDL